MVGQHAAASLEVLEPSEVAQQVDAVVDVERDRPDRLDEEAVVGGFGDREVDAKSRCSPISPWTTATRS